MEFEVGQEIAISGEETTPSTPADVTVAPETSDTSIIFEMPSGKIGSLARKFTGANIRNATRAAGDDPGKFTWFIACELVQIDGKPLHYDEMLTMDGSDVFVLLGIANRVMGKGAEILDTLQLPI